MVTSFPFISKITSPDKAPCSFQKLLSATKLLKLMVPDALGDKIIAPLF